MAALIDEEGRRIIAHGYETAKRIVTAKRPQMDTVVERLMVVETIDATELEQLMTQSPQDSAAASSAG